jgi:hypothetical protein
MTPEPEPIPTDGINRTFPLALFTTDPDHDRLHGCRDEITAILEDDAGEVTGDIRDTLLYRVRLEDGTEVDVRWRDLRPP